MHRQAGRIFQQVFPSHQKLLVKVGVVMIDISLKYTVLLQPFTVISADP
jgi:hypothetical protein